MAARLLDSSALLAFFLAEPGGDSVRPLIGEAMIASANLCEVATKLIDRGIDPDAIEEEIGYSSLAVEPVLEVDAFEAAKMRTSTRRLGLSLGDRLCLAVAHRLDIPAVTADRRWAELALGVEVELIR